MEPQKCWQDLLVAYSKRDHERVPELAHALLDWLAKRGPPPLLVRSPALPRTWHHDLTYMACHYMLGNCPSKTRKRSRRRKKPIKT